MDKVDEKLEELSNVKGIAVGDVFIKKTSTGILIKDNNEDNHLTMADNRGMLDFHITDDQRKCRTETLLKEDLGSVKEAVKDFSETDSVKEVLSSAEKLMDRIKEKKDLSRYQNIKKFNPIRFGLNVLSKLTTKRLDGNTVIDLNIKMILSEALEELENVDAEDEEFVYIVGYNSIEDWCLVLKDSTQELSLVSQEVFEFGKSILRIFEEHQSTIEAVADTAVETIKKVVPETSIENGLERVYSDVTETLDDHRKKSISRTE